MLDPLSPMAGVNRRLILAAALIGLVWLVVWWALA